MDTYYYIECYHKSAMSTRCLPVNLLNKVDSLISAFQKDILAKSPASKGYPPLNMSNAHVYRASAREYSRNARTCAPTMSLSDHKITHLCVYARHTRAGALVSMYRTI